MKNRIFFLFMLLGVLFSFQSCDKDEDIIFPEYPQDKLQFSKAILFELEGTYVSGTGNNIILDSIEMNVATNKVLKIENIAVATLENGVPTDIAMEIYLQDATLISWTANQEIRHNNLPFWLPMGVYELKVFVSPGNVSNSFSGKAIISAIEYDVIQ